jgi:hypothetical protein
MSVRPHALPPVPEATAVRAAFPEGNLYMDLRAEFGRLYDDQRFADFCAPHGGGVAVATWRLALVMVRQYIEGLTDCRAADAVRCGIRISLIPSSRVIGSSTCCRDFEYPMRSAAADQRHLGRHHRHEQDVGF